MSYSIPLERCGFEWPTNRSVAIRDSAGPTRVVVDQPDPTYRPRPVGFLANLDGADPLLWEGDNA